VQCLVLRYVISGIPDSKMARGERTLESLANRILDLDGIIAKRAPENNYFTQKEA